MPRPPKLRSAVAAAPRGPDATMLDLIDKLLDKGAVLDGDITLGVAGVDLIYLRLSALLCAVDLLLREHADAVPGRRSRDRLPEPPA